MRARERMSVNWIAVALVIGIPFVSYMGIEVCNSSGWGMICFMTCLVQVVLLIALISCKLCWIGEIAKMRNFYENDFHLLKKVVRDSKKIRLDKGQLPVRAEEMAYVTLGEAISQRIADLTNKVIEYNRQLTELRAYNENPFLKCFVPPVPGDLELIKLEKIDTN